MIEIKRILCPIDFSDFSQRTADHALAIARWYEATVTLLHVRALVPIAPAVPEMLPAMALTAEDRDELLAALARFVPADAAVTIEREVVEGHAATEIVERAKAMSSDLVVLGTHGRSGFERLLLGSVTERVLRKSPCPVLSVPRHAGDTAPVQPLFKRILCAVDFSDSSMRALDYAISLAQEADACLTVLHVFDLEGAMSEHWRDRLTPPSLRKELETLENERRDRLTRAIRASVGTYCDVETVMTGGTPYREILRLAGEKQSELIVMGVHGRHAADLLFFGSTTNHVVRQAPCPVLTIRQA
ncbi:MAG TPA: universal stress protein [Vicinamibacterales bacterium]|nr:universal stress protein [Vicinamibacterales bacterium]